METFSTFSGGCNRCDFDGGLPIVSNLFYSSFQLLIKFYTWPEKLMFTFFIYLGDIFVNITPRNSLTQECN